jgi:aminoglycoside 6-adenylyltransferase
MLELIVGTAREEERIRAVIMNGSRANPNAPRDFFQDFDIVYLVTEVPPFKHNLEWIQRFGEWMILQMPEEMDDPEGMGGDCEVYLMQFADGNRIDLGIFPLEKAAEMVQDSESVVLLDKDGRIGSIPPASDRDYLPKSPTAKAFGDCCNEFWWLAPYAAKGLWRGELLYALQMLEYRRTQLLKMLVWQIGEATNYSCSPGKFGKYFQRYLEPEVWQQLLSTYPAADETAIWEALFAISDLFRGVALRIARQYGYEYPRVDDERVSAHLRHVRDLPRDAEEMYP